MRDGLVPIQALRPSRQTVKMPDALHLALRSPTTSQASDSGNDPQASLIGPIGS
ncbi:hypothetical protein KPSA3_04288 [Pseudomonas syringae pv. actinidiae]|uniref:Uncharacterized protein n=1 Tax=Pseudomonas syringae pv. actinidiae TaxID=103796 RepID=A0AAN4Q6J8_PSESF|nr:hypothetical protein KPSA3_04288 [Pseudomonas syringae pv. actinidiae]